MKAHTTQLVDALSEYYIRGREYLCLSIAEDSRAVSAWDGELRGWAIRKNLHLGAKTQRHCERTKEGQRIFKWRLHILFRTLLITYERNLLNKNVSLLAPMTKL